jgi:hypothetical protein
VAGFRHPRVLIQRAAGGNRELARGLTTLDARLSRIEQATSHSASNPSRQRPQVSTPPSSRLNVYAQAGTGRIQIAITLPQFLSPRAGRFSNQTQAPIWHEVSYATSADFRQGLIVLPPTTQTYIPVSEVAGKRFYFRMRSSFDGRNWGSYIRSAVVKA